MKLPRLNPLTRLSLGLTAIVVTFVLMLDILGVIPDREGALKEVRQRISENLGLHVTFILRRGDMQELGQLLNDVKTREPDILSVALRKVDGSIGVQIGEHTLHWQPPAKGYSDVGNVSVPLFANKQPWGNLELSFRPSAPRSISDWLGNNLVAILLILGVGGFFAFILYLRRALFYLDPTSAVPERVRHAFDSLREGILVLDQAGHIMLTNTAFTQLHPGASINLIGQNINEQTWLVAGLGENPAQHPWNLMMADGQAREGIFLEVMQPDGGKLKTILNISPVRALSGAIQGSLISIDNVSELHQANEKLMEMVLELNETRLEIDKKNKELLMLANRDALTGCLNRRSMFEMMESFYVQAHTEGTTLCCIMADIDHFKSFNDRFGHSVGDEVIRAVVRCLQSQLRQQDALFRYGGEEFCILLPNLPLEQACQVAERLRKEVEQHAASSLRTIHDVRITSSFGVAELDHFMLDPAELVGRADEAMYKSKQSGRNRVTSWQLEVAATT